MKLNPEESCLTPLTARAVPIKLGLTSISSLLNLNKVPLFLSIATNMLITQVGGQIVSNAICAESVVPEEYHEYIYIYTIYILIYMPVQITL